MTDQTIRLGADIGGTFTDVVLEAGGRMHSVKVLTRHDAPEEAIADGLARVCAGAGIDPGKIGQIIHGTTLATNALIERRGARTALITTHGFRDVIEMRTESRFEQYDLNLALPDPLLPRYRRHTLRERVDADGNILVPLDPGEVETLARDLAEAGYDSIAVGFLHSYANDAHETQVGDILARHLPEVMISLSSQVSPQMREYERFSTTIANAYIKPLMKSYLGRLAGRLRAAGAHCPVYLMHSGGGIIDLATAAEFPVRLVESGPAGGAIFAADIAARHGLDKVLSFDMGGTTAKICLIRDQSPKTARVFEVARSYRFKKGSGMPISIPVIDMVEIGAGGGSLAHVDALHQIRVGPESAGSDPGPAAYGRGGTRPAVTDADLILGRLDPANFAGGSIALDPAAAAAAIDRDLGDVLNMSTQEAAFGLSEVVDETMANAARVHAVENGEDLGDYTMIAFGGAAPLHAGRLCEKLGIAHCLIPPGAGVGSAIGFLRAPFSFEANRSVMVRLSAFDAVAVRSLWADLLAEATGFVRAAEDGEILADYKVYVRYAGQGWEIPVDLDPQDADMPDADRFAALFETAYTGLFSRKVAGAEIEITGWSVRAYSAPLALPGDQAADQAGGPARAGRSRAASARVGLFDPALGRAVEAAQAARADLAAGDSVPGPALIPEDETTLVVPSSRQVTVAGDGCLIMDERDISEPEDAAHA
ncbi:MAG: hydantoinase/oxoprolinase family protein [Marinibacterium sp.]